MFIKWKPFLAALILLVTQFGGSAFAEQTTAATSELPREQVQQYTFGGGVFWNKSVQFANGDTYWFKRFAFQKTIPQKFFFSFIVPGKKGSFRYVEHSLDHNGKTAKGWKIIPLNSTLPRTYGFIETDQKKLLISFPDIYKQGLNHTLKETALSYPLRVQEVPNGYKIIVEFSQVAGTIGEVWALESDLPLVDWSKPNLEKIWMLLDLQVEQKWSWDGFYVLTPSTYYPTGKRLFWRIPENYVAKSFVMTGGSRAAYDLGWVMVKTILPQQNKQGFWPTLPESTWLKRDYGIQAGFYDTRFNTDMASIIAKAAIIYHDPDFMAANKRYADFFLAYSEGHHTVVQGEREGWLVADYAHYGKPHRKTHTSLNHQLQEINYLLELFMMTQDPRYQQLADKLLYGIKNTATRWIKPNADLFYAYMPNGEMGRVDYPYLTYNDLWLTQHYLLKLTGSTDPDLLLLMGSKKSWMDANGITGYRQDPV